jgi:hypothetical protein
MSLFSGGSGQGSQVNPSSAAGGTQQAGFYSGTVQTNIMGGGVFMLVIIGVIFLALLFKNKF